jgi:hypothetical protein
MSKIRFEDMVPKEVYSVFFNAITNREGKIITTTIDGLKKPIFVLKRNPFNEKLVMDLETLSIHQIKTLFGRIVNINKVLDIRETNNEAHKDKFKEELGKLSSKFSEDMKSAFVQKMQKKAAAKRELKNREFRPRELKRELKPKIKPKRPMVRRSIAK